MDKFIHKQSLRKFGGFFVDMTNKKRIKRNCKDGQHRVWRNATKEKKIREMLEMMLSGKMPDDAKRIDRRKTPGQET